MVGAGVAIAATGGNPVAGWIGLLRHGVKRIAGLGLAPTGQWAARQTQVLDEAEAGHGDMADLLIVAEQISDRLGAPHNGEWVSWLEDTVGSLKPAADRALLEAIGSLGIPVATTNHDGLLEEVTKHPAVTWEQTGAVVKLLRGEQMGILHLHGFWAQPSSVVLGIRDYQRVLGAGTAQHVQRVLPTLNGLLYIGCGAGLTDPNFSALRAWIRNSLPGTTHRHIRLGRSRDVAALKKEHDRSERTFVLGFGADFDELASFLKKLAEDAGVRVAELRSRPPIKQAEHKSNASDGLRLPVWTSPSVFHPAPAVLGKELSDLAVFRDIEEPWCPEMVVLPRGSFTMGSPEAEPGRYESEGPEHEVMIDYRLAMGRYPVSVSIYFADPFRLHGGGPYIFNIVSEKWELDNSKSWRDPGRPQADNSAVFGVSWDDARAYVGWLASRTGKPYRLASEAEWEYAARAGTKTPVWFGTIDKRPDSAGAFLKASFDIGNRSHSHSRSSRSSQPLGTA